MKRLLLIAFTALSLNAIAQTNIFPSSGNVGIGTDSPQANLHIKSSTSSYAFLRLESLSTGQNASTQYVSGGLWRWELGTGISSGTNFELYDRVNNKTCFVIKPDGFMGIGITNPEAPLEIKSQTSHRGLIIGRENLSTKIYLHVAEGNYGYLDLGGNTQLRGNGQSSYFDGSLGIGTTNPAYKLDVLGTIRAKEVLVNLDGGADFVFEKGYKLLPIEHVATYVQENKHLPDIPSANEMVKNGVSMGELQVKLLQKVEEQTLYIIGLNNELQVLKKQIKELQGNKQ